MKHAFAWLILVLVFINVAAALPTNFESSISKIKNGCDVVASNQEFVHIVTQTINEEFDAFLSEDEVSEIVFLRCMGRLLNEKAEHRLNEQLSQNRQRS